MEAFLDLEGIYIMANIGRFKEPPKLRIETWFGLNKDPAGDTQARINEATVSLNVKILKSMKPQLREGQTVMLGSLGAGEVRGMETAEFSGTDYLFLSHGGQLKKWDFVAGSPTNLGAIADNQYIDFFIMRNILYLVNGTNYKQYDGTTFQDTVPYIPKTVSGKSPDGTGGQFNEELNMLTGGQQEGFVGDAVSKDFFVDEINIDSVDEVIVDDVVLSTPADYTFSLALGKISMVVAPSDGSGLEDDNVLITFTEGSGNPEYIRNCRATMLFGGNSDTRVFFWGNVNFPNRRFHSALYKPNYIPINNFADVGDDQNELMDLLRDQDNMLIASDRDAFSSEYLLNTDGSVTFPIKNLSDNIGSKPFNQGRVVDGRPITVFDAMRRWVTTDIRDQRASPRISDNIQPDLDAIGLSEAITANWQRNREYWLAHDGDVWVWNYQNDQFYQYDNIDATCFLEIGGELWFGTEAEIRKMDASAKSDDGDDIAWEYFTGSTDWGSEDVLKFANSMYCTVRPENHVEVFIEFYIDGKKISVNKPITYTLATFLEMDFADFGFSTSRSPQSQRRKTKIKGTSRLQIRFFGQANDKTMTLLSFTMPYELVGEIK